MNKSSGKKFVALRAFFRIITKPFRALFNMLADISGGPKGLIKKLFLLAGIGVVSVVLFLVGAIAYYSSDVPDAEDGLIKRQISQSTKIYDRTGEELLYEIAGDEKRTIVRLEELPEYVAQAHIAIEDKTFYEHNGFRYRRIIRAVLHKVLGLQSLGASTITSQLVKNAILTPEKTISRKLKEWILVYHVEKKFSKEMILESYLNEIPYGGRAYGIEAAANQYFDKESKDLTIAEAATLAGITNLPTYYSPYGDHLDKLLDRKNLVLQEMFDQGYITEEQLNESKEQELVFKPRREEIIAPHFIFYVQQKLAEIYGDHMVNNGGLVVKTTLDLEKQELAEEIVAEQAEKNRETYNAQNAALVSIDPKNGEILAMVGSADYFNEEIDGNVNVALRPRQPGSSFKPMVYTYGWQRGYTPSSILFDVVTRFPGNGQAYEPKNYDLKERGPISIRKALQGSLNVPAVKMLYLLGVDNVLSFASDLGYTTLTDPERFGLSLVLGGAEVTLLEHTAAYATLANEGEYHEPIGILEVSTTAGDLLDEFESDGKRVMDENIARITSNVLSDDGARAYAFGTGSLLTLPGRQVAAKTGTTNDYRDAWTLGYTPSLATGVWVGNNDFSEMERGAGGSRVAAPIWNSYMRQALSGTPAESFTAPKIDQPEKAILSGKGFGVQAVTIDKASGKLATDKTPASFREEKLFIDAHTILYYVDKRNPLGPAPSNPASSDPQFTSWEAAVQAWIEKTIEEDKPLFGELENQELPENIEIVYGLPPEEEDDLHVIENQPSISFVSPDDGIELNTRELSAEVEADAPRGISRVEFYLDGIFLTQDSSSPYRINTSLKTFPNGFYELKAIAFDDIDNSREVTRRVKLQSDETYVKLRWQSPDDNSNFIIGQGSIPLQLNIDSQEKINQITFFANDDLIQAIVNPDMGVIEVVWNPAQTGTYEIYTKVSVGGSGVLNSPSLSLKIEEPPKEDSENQQ